jgi:hypothetical protein
MDPLPPAPAGTSSTDTTSSAAITALVLSVLGLFCCGGLLSPFGWYLGQQELKAVDAGRSSPGNRPLALIAVVIGIIGTAMFALGALWILLFGGLAMFAGLLGAVSSL